MSKWEVEFELELNRYQIKYNALDQEGEIKYNQSVVVDRRITVEQLKEKIAQKLGKTLDVLVFKRGGSNGAELVEDELGIKQANVYSMMSLFVERGEPTRMGWKRL